MITDHVNWLHDQSYLSLSDNHPANSADKYNSAVLTKQLVPSPVIFSEAFLVFMKRIHCKLN